MIFLKPCIRIILIFFFSLFFVNTVQGEMNFDSKMNVFENYLKNQKLSIEKICSVYDICQNRKIKNFINGTNELIINIQTLKTIPINTKDREIIIKSISGKVQYLSSLTKKHIKHEVEASSYRVKKIKKHYNTISLKIESTIDKIISNTYITNIQRKDSSIYTKNIIKILVAIQSNKKQLENFRRIVFSSESTMKNHFLIILLEIKHNILSLQKNIKK